MEADGDSRSGLIAAIYSVCRSRINERGACCTLENTVHMMSFPAEAAATWQASVADMIVHIQQEEYGIPITREQQPDLQDIAGFYQQGNGNFWLAYIGEQVVGTIALLDIGQQQVALRKMFVHQDYRGKAWGSISYTARTSHRMGTRAGSTRYLSWNDSTIQGSASIL